MSSYSHCFLVCLCKVFPVLLVLIAFYSIQELPDCHTYNKHTSVLPTIKGFFNCCFFFFSSLTSLTRHILCLSVMLIISP